MGLDMYLRGKKYMHQRWDLEGEAREAAQRKEDGYRIAGVELDLGYWRKHPDLHGYIVQEFGGGEDNCEEVNLEIADLQKIIDAVERKDLPHTTGFFFGSSAPYWYDPEQVEYTTKALMGARRWLEEQPEHETRAILYQASW